MSERSGGLPAARWISFLVLAVGVAMVAIGAVSYSQVASAVTAENIVVSRDACLAGEQVTGPFTAYCEAGSIRARSLAATGGRTFVQLDLLDPAHDSALSAHVARSALLSYVTAFAVAALTFFTGVAIILAGAGLLALSRRQ
jgi:hypothetical protein